jgi:hypothetical protein
MFNEMKSTSKGSLLDVKIDQKQSMNFTSNKDPLLVDFISLNISKVFLLDHPVCDNKLKKKVCFEFFILLSSDLELYENKMRLVHK